MNEAPTILDVISRYEAAAALESGRAAVSRGVRRALFLNARGQGYTVSAIAAAAGISRQRVEQVIGGEQ